MTPEETLTKLRNEVSNDIFHLALVMKAARTLGEWHDAYARLSDKLEIGGDMLDQHTPADLGFVQTEDQNEMKKLTPLEDLLARGERLESALHYFCGPCISYSDDCDCTACKTVRREFSLLNVE